MFLDYISKCSLASQFLWTGGTALAYIYNHRLSTDLDFFTEQLLWDFEILPLIQDIKKNLHIDHIQQHISQNRRIYLCDESYDHLKFEITFFPFTSHYSTQKRNNTICIDSPIDIAINKVHAISEREEPKDVVDLYYILKNTNTTIETLIIWVEQKFGVYLEYKTILARVLYIAEQLDSITPFMIDQDYSSLLLKQFFISKL